MKRVSKKLSRLPLSPLAFSGLLVLLGGGLLLAQLTLANIKFEAEAGIPTGQAQMASDTSASGGQYLNFAAGTSGTVQFFEDFTTAASVDRFDYQLTAKPQLNGCDNDPQVEPGCGDLSPTFLGEHDMACNGPTTYRTIHTNGKHGHNNDMAGTEVVWYCAPGDDTAKGHMMTALDTTGIATLSFSPKPVFNNVTKVCWDQNMNDLGGAKWLNIFIVPASDATRYAKPGTNSAWGLGYDAASARGLAVPLDAEQPLPANSYEFTWLMGTTFVGHGPRELQWKSYIPGGMDASSAPRYKICLQDRGNSIVIKRPDGTTDTYASQVDPFPTGQVKVIFQDGSYNPTKHGGSDAHLTWHWDNILVE